MKNKILASLLAVCLFAGLAVPAFAVSSQSGSFDEVTKAEFRKTSYEIKNGTSDEDMKAELMAFVSTKQLVQDPEIEWSVENDGKYAFGVSDGKVTCSEDSGTATLVAKITSAKGVVTATTKLVATKKDADRPTANGFTFKSNTNTLLTGTESFLKGDAKGNTITIVPTPSNAYFTSAQISYLDTTVLSQLTLDVKKADGTSSITLAANAGVYNADDREYVVDFLTTADIKASITQTLAGTGGATAADLTFDGVDVSIVSGMDAAAAATALATAYKAADTTATPKNYVVTASGATLTYTAKKSSTAAPTVPTSGTPVNGITPTTDATKTIVAAASTGLAAVDTTKSAAQSVTVKASAFPTPTVNNIANTNNVERRVSIATVAAKQATTMNAAGTVTIEVGERMDVAKNFKQGPSNANVTHDVNYSMEYADTSAQYNDFADIVKQSTSECIVEGVAVGTNKIRAIDQTNGKEAVITVNVVAKGTKPAVDTGKNTTVLSAWAPKIGVGETANIVVKATKAVTYTSLDTAIATVDAAGKLTAVKEGTAKIKVQEEGKDAVYVSLTVTAKTTTPGGTTDVPQTAVVALAPLF